MSRKIFRSVMTVAMVVLLSSLIIVNGFLYNYFNRLQVERLTEELSLATAGVEHSGVDYFENYNSSMFRFTVVSESGDVVYDSEAKTEKMENHLDREEIKEASATGRGSSARYSSTLTERTFYEAVRLKDGSILRISATQVTIGALIIGMMPAICAIILFSLVIAIILSDKAAKSIVKPLDDLNLEEPADNDTYDELSPLLTKLNRQHKQIAEQMKELKRRADEFEQITDSMKEGLVLIDKKGEVISINRAAQKLFNTDLSVVGCDFLTVDRTSDMSLAVSKAICGEHTEFRIQRNGGEYQIMITPTVFDGKTVGAVMLCIDVTESAFAERNRQEFTANVSHELKTPLQSIIGSAELLQNGLVKAEDVEKFVGNIKNEAQRLVALISDIIRLSGLDEKAQKETEAIDLYSLSADVAEVLRPAAQEKNVTVSVSGDSCVINGVRSYLYEIIYNLLDNAVRYNKVGGSVSVLVKKDGNHTLLSVEDTGIGVPSEHQNRIFERFYRVDKSHSRETGGTGLGLSIVKHAAEFHNAEIYLESEVGKGTKITVVF